tara:strand:+ start:3119 stop:3820 length:702 start_codon:yes stop_codon:yes gene_type:complete
MKLNFNNSNCSCGAIAILFIFGLIYYINFAHLYENMENMENKGEKTHDNKRCPNMLVEKDGEIYLYNSKKATVPGVNPIKFDNLEEYSEFVEWQKSQNIECPILYLQYTTDTQNNELLQVKPSIFENSGGLPAIKTKNLIGKEDNAYYEKNKMLNATLNSTPNSNMKFNDGMYSSYDQYNQNVGLDTPLDKMFTEKNKTSANPMDTHWGGKNYTKSRVASGDYKGREVYKYDV